MALDIICQGCQDLGDYERELLPQLHQLWPSLVTLFRHSDKCIVIKAIKTLLMLSKLSGDFMRSRIMKEVIPGISSYMKQQALISCESRSAYLYTNNHKLQLCVLTSLGPLAENLKLDSNDLAAVVDICLPYLSELQPVALQQAAVDSCSSFYTLEPDALWFTLNMIYSPLLLTPPGPEYFPMKFPVNNENNKNFVKNISYLLEKYYSL
ncbi:TEL2-interacting protein 1 [Bulinus truncatus]|nr:TEL2-interacting protein 1 [Bulinus truncatus]